jgi:DNA-binding protein YbaB
VDLRYLVRQAKKLEKAVSDARAELSTVTVDAESGGGLVRADPHLGKATGGIEIPGIG